MSFAISSITPPVQIQPAEFTSSQSAGGGEFKSLFDSAVQQVESSRQSADAAVRSYLSGENTELHSTVLATQNAELQFDMFMQVRNKVVSAYQEIMKMQV
jgi:flagellar hook-basal body complex protein FliE